MGIDAPQFLILGAQRGGTTSLYHYLTAHPHVVPAARKELHYFSFLYHRGLDWYRAQFQSDLSPGIITGEASPYYLFHPHAARRLREHAPHSKLIVLLRDPVARAYSHYQHEVRIGAETLPFEEAIAQEESRLRGEPEKMLIDETYYSFNHQHFSYLARGRYVDQLQQWLAIFPRQQLLVLESEDLYRDPAAIVQRVTAFLGLPPAIQGEYEAHNAGSSPPLSRQTRECLAASFANANRRLQTELGLDLTWIDQ